jgi:hypothetical protein
MDPTIEVPGTGLTVGDLTDAGYSASDISAMFSAGDVPSSGISSTLIGPTVADGGGGGGNSSWISGLGGFLGSVGTAVTNITRAVNPPKAGTPLYNPATGLPYGIDPRTGRPVVSAQTSSLVTVVVFVLIAIAVLWSVRHI